MTKGRTWKNLPTFLVYVWFKSQECSLCWVSRWGFRMDQNDCVWVVWERQTRTWDKVTESMMWCRCSAVFSCNAISVTSSRVSLGFSQQHCVTSYFHNLDLFCVLKARRAEAAGCQEMNLIISDEALNVNLLLSWADLREIKFLTLN